MKTIAAVCAGCMLMMSAWGTVFAQSAPQDSKDIAAAVADSSRPPSDTDRDANRKPADTLAFIGLKAGDNIADYAPGQGYFTRLFSALIGPRGHVYAVVPSALFQYPNIVRGTADIETYAVNRPNVTVTFAAALEGLKFPRKLDVFWIAQNYHDLHDSFMGPVDMAAFNKGVFNALKPGGLYIVLDHAAAPGAPADVTDSLHRIEASVVRREVEAAGFRLVGESTILANPADPRTAGVFDKTIRGHTDQFLLKFRRP